MKKSVLFILLICLTWLGTNVLAAEPGVTDVSIIKFKFTPAEITIN
ncbi:hypothetical protein, partial [Thiolapillus sp.]